MMEHTLQTGDHKDLYYMLEDCERASQPLMVWGASAIGKSSVVRNYGMARAESMGRTFSTWHALSKADKQRMYSDAEFRKSMYILYDNRAAGNDQTDDKGIPNLQSPDYLVWVQNLILNVFAAPETEGILFYDEITLAPPSVLNAMYMPIHDRAVGDIAFNDSVFVVCAGNRVEDRAFVQDMPWPLRMRMCHFELHHASPKEQVDWFMKNGVDNRLIAFFSAHTEYLFTGPGTVGWKSDTSERTASMPRTIEALSDFISTLEYPKHASRIRNGACGWLGTNVGTFFVKFLDRAKELDLDEYLTDPKLAKDLCGLDEKYGLISLATSRYGNTKDAKKRKALLAKIFDLYEFIDAELGILMIRMMYEKNPNVFKKDVPSCKKWVKIAKNVGKYIL